MYIPSSKAPGYDAFISRYNSRAVYEGNMSRITNKVNSSPSYNMTSNLADTMSRKAGIGNNVDLRI